MLSEYGIPVIFLQSQPSFAEVASSWAQTVIMAVSAIAAVAAAIYAVRTYRVSRSPDVIAYLTTEDDGTALCFDVENLGAGAAYNVAFSFDKSVPLYDDDRGALEGSFIFRGLPMLAPRARRHRFFVHTNDFLTELGYQPLIVTVSYSDTLEGKPAKRARFVLDATTLGSRTTEIG